MRLFPDIDFVDNTKSEPILRGETHTLYCYRNVDYLLSKDGFSYKF